MTKPLTVVEAQALVDAAKEELDAAIAREFVKFQAELLELCNRYKMKLSAGYHDVEIEKVDHALTLDDMPGAAFSIRK